MSRFAAQQGGVAVHLPAGEVAVLSRLTALLGAAGVEASDPARARLEPVVYEDDPAASHEFNRLAGAELGEARAGDRERFDATLQDAANGIVLSAADAAAWLRVLGQARIVLAARSGLFTTGLPEETPTDPETALVMLLGYLQEGLVEEMMTTMEDHRE
jgi:hypothetical protein